MTPAAYSWSLTYGKGFTCRRHHSFYGIPILLLLSIGTPYLAQAHTEMTFNADSAYYFIQQQVALGPRVPNTVAHRACKRCLKKELKKYDPKLVVQKFKSLAFNGQRLQLYNLVASFNPAAAKRLLLATHWDTHPFADKDFKDQGKPIQGANDGASGVGILLEIARNIHQLLPAAIGIDIIFFDGEDYGPPADYPGPSAQKKFFWCLGSQFWCSYPHTTPYRPDYGILLDMVGGKAATFYLEGWSAQHAKDKVSLIWHKAAKLGYGQYFIHQPSGCYILDDHYFITTYRNIPMVLIIDHRPSPQHCFKAYHHTHADQIENINTKALQAVGETLLHVIKDFTAAS
jgi:hypothetical protein